MKVLPGLDDRLHGAIDGRYQLDVAPILKSAQDGLEDGEGHAAQRGERLVAVNALLQVDLPDGIEPKTVQDIHEQPDLHAVARGERHLLKDSPSPRILTRERLYQPREQRVEEIDQGARHQLR